MEYTVDYFIKKFEAIPEDNWITASLYDPEIGCCVLGWCGVRSLRYHTSESRALASLLGIHPNTLYRINDGIADYKHLRMTLETPKQRILAALNNAKNGVK